MNLTEASKKVDSIVEDLQLSIRKEQVEGVFSKHSINDKSERIQLLRKCMRVLDTSNTCASIPLDDEYSDELAIFCSGRWRLLL